MAQENIVKMKCSTCDRVNSWTHKNKKKVERKLALSRFCKWCRAHTKHTEGKKK